MYGVVGKYLWMEVELRIRGGGKERVTNLKSGSLRKPMWVTLTPLCCEW